ncbi:MAG: response regulator [Rickettsiales bacterium]|nr:response regulator [Rickettsiales bacterium]MCA0254403.1 response regulator [Pseudomonadota bacterium]
MARVLIVEDNELNLKLFHDLLTIQEHEVVTSRDGKGILELVVTSEPDLILMDIHLNGLSGIDLVQILKNDSKTSHIPIIVITAFAMKMDEARISKSGCDMYLSKPVSIDKFFKAVEKFLSPIRDNKK